MDERIIGGLFGDLLRGSMEELVSDYVAFSKRLYAWHTKARPGSKWYRRRSKRAAFKGTHSVRVKQPYPKLFDFERELWMP